LNVRFPHNGVVVCAEATGAHIKSTTITTENILDVRVTRV
jgi:hypothetical protein